MTNQTKPLFCQCDEPLINGLDRDSRTCLKCNKEVQKNNFCIIRLRETCVCCNKTYAINVYSPPFECSYCLQKKHDAYDKERQEYIKTHTLMGRIKSIWSFINGK